MTENILLQSNALGIDANEIYKDLLKIIPKCIYEKNDRKRQEFIFRFIFNNGLLGGKKYPDLISVLESSNTEILKLIIHELELHKCREQMLSMVEVFLDDDDQFSDPLGDMYDHILSIMLGNLQKCFCRE